MISPRVSQARMASLRVAARAIAAAVMLAVAAGLLLLAPERLAAASPEPPANPDISMTAEPMLGGSFRAGSWVAVRVTVENGGPAIDGELRMAANARASSTFGLPVQLASGARQEHFLYGQSATFGNRFAVTLVSGDTVHARVEARLDATGAGSLGVFLVAERPEALVGTIRDALGEGARAPKFVSIRPEDLPHRAEAWSAMDLLVWHDVDSAQLESAQLDALRIWALMGGDLVVLGGSTGSSTFDGFPGDLLPYRPTDVIEIGTADLEAEFGSLPGAPPTTAALAGPLERGTPLARSGDVVIAARAAYGQGTVALSSLDPSASWLSGSIGGNAFWMRLLAASSAGRDARLPTDDEFLDHSLANLPSVQLPRSDQLMILILGYIVAIGPLNYFLLKRRDRREWAWLTMPLTIATFAGAAYTFGVVLKGANVVITELVVVQGAAGTDRGLADVRVGIFSPNRASFDVEVHGDALISASSSTMTGERVERPIDVLLGELATVRDYQVGFGAQRTFRVQAAVDTPRLEPDLRLTDGALEGTLTNASSVDVADVAIVYAGGVQRLGQLAAGETRSVEIRANAGRSSDSLARRLYPPTDGEDVASARATAARRALVQHLEGGWEGGMFPTSSRMFAGGPVILAWRTGGVVDIALGSAVEHIGETVFVLPARATAAGHVVFAGGLLEQAALTLDAIDGWTEAGSFALSRGTLAVDYRPGGFEGSFQATGLSFRLGPGVIGQAAADGEPLLPLPDAEQPDSESPLSSSPRAGEGEPDVPRVQLFDRAAGSWVEFEPIRTSRTYVVSEPGRYVDTNGSFRVRFVVRGNDYAEFSFGARLEGEVE